MNDNKDKAQKKRYTLQGEAFAKVEALSHKYIEARQAADKMQEEASKALWTEIASHCPGLDLDGNDFRLNREYRDEGILFVEDGACDCGAQHGGGLVEALKNAMRKAAESTLGVEEEADKTH